MHLYRHARDAELAHRVMIVLYAAVDFFATWCNACRGFFPKWIKTVAEEQKVLFVCVEYDENKDWVTAMGVEVCSALPHGAAGHVRSRVGNWGSWCCPPDNRRSSAGPTLHHKGQRLTRFHICRINPPRSLVLTLTLTLTLALTLTPRPSRLPTPSSASRRSGRSRGHHGPVVYHERGLSVASLREAGT